MFNPLQYLASPHDPCQQPSHRWLRCQYLLEYGRPPTPRDDKTTRGAYAFLMDWQRCSSDLQREPVARAHPALAQAHWLYQGASITQRGEVEARLLAGQHDESIAGRCSLSTEEVQLFHDLFFDVRSRLRTYAYILNVAIGPKYHQGLRCDDYDVILKVAGYTLGPLGIDALLAYWADPPVWPVSLALLDGPALEALQAKLRVQVWIQVLTLPANADTAARLPVIQRLLAQAGALGNRSASDDNSVLSACRAALDFRSFLSATQASAGKAAAPVSVGVVSSLGQRSEPVMHCPEQWQAVPA
jgi:hypothetical protein